jgi:hypothetical protein
MGYSPHADFKTLTGEQYHWEAKDNYLALWNHNESKQPLRLSYEEALKALDQLRECLLIAGINVY